MLDSIITSKVRRKILMLFFHNNGQVFHLRQVAREIDEEINAVKRELDILEKGNVLLKEKRLNKSIYTINQKYLFLDEFTRIFAKETPLVRQLLKLHSNFGKVNFIAISLKLFKKEEISDSEVYILFVGVIVGPEIQKIIQSVEKDYPFEINYTIMPKDEFEYRKRKNDPFIWGFLKNPKLMVVGDETQLMS